MSSVERNPLILGILIAIVSMTLIAVLAANVILENEVTTTPVFVTSTDYYEAAITATYVKSITTIENTVKTMVAPQR